MFTSSRDRKARCNISKKICAVITQISTLSSIDRHFSSDHTSTFISPHNFSIRLSQLASNTFACWKTSGTLSTKKKVILRYTSQINTMFRKSNSFLYLVSWRGLIFFIFNSSHMFYKHD